MRFTGDTERLKRFQQEARAVVGLNHPNILTVYEIGEDHATHYIASELIEGATLRQRLMRGRMELSEAMDVAIQVASALAAAHEAGIVHRDIKPENVMIRPDGYVKVLDFGIAKLAEPEVPVKIPAGEALLLVETNQGSILGTVRYMSPEQAHGVPVDQGTDIWSLGVVLYEMVTGHAPFGGDTPREVLSSILETEPAPLTDYLTPSPAELQQIISTTLRKNRQERYRSVPELIEALKKLRRGMEFKAELARSTPASSRLRWTRSPITLALVLLGVAALLTVPFFWNRNGTTNPPWEKSIAVLPFEDFSDNQENSYFAAGIQDDVLTSLAQIHELKVISRTSVMAYQKAGGRNMREISRALGVANVLEGSVRRTGNRVLVNVQLIDARNDRHLWAERYDRPMANSIGLQGELATQIASALKARLAPEEKTRLDARPTSNSEAYVLYLTALGMEDSIETEKIFMQAVALDPGFALAYAQASIRNSSAFEDKLMRKAKARAQAEEALRLAPALGEAHMALGLCLYWGEKNYDAALKEFEVAAASSPNNADILGYVGGIYRRQGRWRESIDKFERARSLDPRNASAAFRAANNYLFMRDWPAAAAGFQRALEIGPDSVLPKLGLAYVELFRTGDLAGGRRILQTIPARLESNGPVNLARWELAMLERDYASAEKIATESPAEDFSKEGGAPREVYQGRMALARGDMESALRYFGLARPIFEKRVRDDPSSPTGHRELGLILAYMQIKEDAIRESLRAVELEPESQNAFHGPINLSNLALVYALLGEPAKAIPIIERLVTLPGPVQWPDFPSNMTLAELRLRPEWDSLRSNPRFQTIIAGPEPRTILPDIQNPAHPAGQ
jgi:serine/threonine protein kinase/Tfp pilus assembly protein PilF